MTMISHSKNTCILINKFETFYYDCDTTTFSFIIHSTGIQIKALKKLKKKKRLLQLNKRHKFSDFSIDIKKIFSIKKFSPVKIIPCWIEKCIFIHKLKHITIIGSKWFNLIRLFDPVYSKIKTYKIMKIFI